MQKGIRVRKFVHNVKAADAQVRVRASEMTFFLMRRVFRGIQPSGCGGIIVVVVGEVTVISSRLYRCGKHARITQVDEERNPVKFTQMFHLMPQVKALSFAR